MATLLITYDLNQPGQKYDALYKLIDSLGAWFHPLDSTWFVKTTLSATEVTERIGSVLDEGDAWFVCDVTNAASSGYMDSEFWPWLRG
ncbi:hypothetical protein [Dietzia cinnamea]|uniref:hypothetical protein n=1 Tax=Dietzia cinnamea TaxID=321318 RepID=UPI0021A92074|nr:hypothetical protein [Dietzia cinnamea]MCT1639747.1 hypothetical protein [Dietzia cinnamea]